jgi:hypothetical protein
VFSQNQYYAVGLRFHLPAGLNSGLCRSWVEPVVAFFDEFSCSWGFLCRSTSFV